MPYASHTHPAHELDVFRIKHPHFCREMRKKTHNHIMLNTSLFILSQLTCLQQENFVVICDANQR